MTEIREAINSAFEKSGPAETAPPPQESGPPIEAVGTDDAPPPGELPSEAAPSTPSAPVKDPKTGKFLPRGAAPAVAPAQKAVVTPLGAPAQAIGTPEATPASEPPKPTAPAVKAPQSWRPEVREKWASLPPEVQAEVARREKEVGAALQESATARKGWESFREVVGPYEALIRAEGGEPLKAVGSLLQTAAALRTAPPAMKAKLVANIIQQYGVPVDVLDAALAGHAPAAPAQGTPPQQLDPEALLQQAEQRVFQRIQGQQQQALTAKAQQEAEAFISGGEAEFIEEESGGVRIRDLMANFLDAAGRSGVRLTLKDAYDRACAIHPEVSKVLEQRKAAQTATASQAATQRAKAAASSVRSQPAAPPQASQPDDLRSLIEANWTRASGR